MNVFLLNFKLLLDMTRTYVKKTERRNWGQNLMTEAIKAAKGGMSCNMAAKLHNVPEATLRRYLKLTSEVLY